MHLDYRKLLETACMSCVVDVVGWQDAAARLDQNEPVNGWVNVGVISNDLPLFYRTWRGRLGRALAAVRARDYPFLEFYSREELEAFMAALAEAADVAFSPPRD